MSQVDYARGFEDATIIKNEQVDRLIEEKKLQRLWLREQGLLLEACYNTILVLVDDNNELRIQLAQWLGRVGLIEKTRECTCA